MGSLFLSTTPSAAAATCTNTLPPSPLFSTSSHRFKTHVKQTHRLKVSCNHAADDDDKTLKSSQISNLKRSLDLQNVDRRNLLLGFGGLYGGVNLTSIPSAFAAPITTPDSISKDCGSAESSSLISNKKEAVRTLACCPPELSTDPPKRYVMPENAVVRVRPAAQRVSYEYQMKYQEAIKKMKDLPDNDPRSFKQQAMIHCAYCNSGYHQKEYQGSRKEIQIHNSWLFFPFHRWYLYFFERIMGKLIDDPTFAIPYWNWDHPSGMTIPAMFEDELKANPAFNAYRDGTHLPPAIVDLDYNGTDRNVGPIDQMNVNLSTMYRQMTRNATDTESFFGGMYVAGSDPYPMGHPSVGSIESGCHTAMHRWVGNSRMPNNEDMGNFYSAGYDPLFYAHHANVDRMWNIWKDLKIKGHNDPSHEDWLDASYVFYDENQQLVRVYNKDCIDNNRMGFEYETSSLPWYTNRPIPRNMNAHVGDRSTVSYKAKEVKFPVSLNRIVQVLVKRPSVNRTKEEKAKANEMLIVDGIRFDSAKFVKFDVYVNDKDNVPPSSAAESEFAGSFAQLPHGYPEKMLATSSARFGLTELLEDIQAEDDDSVLVTLVPKAGTEDVQISEIRIELVPIK